VCSGRHCRTTHSERMQGDTEPSQMVSINETWAMFHDGELSHSSKHLPACSDGPVTSWRASHRDASLHPPGTAHHPAPSWPSSKTKRGGATDCGSPTCPSAPALARLAGLHRRRPRAHE
jgi:hypothetical protein